MVLKIAVSDRCPDLLNAWVDVTIVPMFLEMVLFISWGEVALPLNRVHWYHHICSKLHCTTQSLVMSHLSHSTMSNITWSATSNNSSSLSSSAESAVGVVPPAVVPSLVEGAVGAAAFLQVRATQAAAIATAAANDAAAVSSAHSIIIGKHRTMFLQHAFGINPDGTAVDQAVLTNCLKKYKSVKTIDQYNNMVRCLTHWGEDEYLAAAPEEDMKATRFYRFRRQHSQGYNYAKYFRIEDSKSLDGSPKKILIHKNTGGIVVHMLAVFNVIHKAHCRLGHLAVDKTLAGTKPAHYSPTYELCKIYCKNCYVCIEKQPTVPPRKGAKKPIISSEFHDHFQVDLIDMRNTMKKDVYKVMQCWIMTIKDHSTGLVYLAVLPRKTAVFVVDKLEKYFGFVRYPHIFHTGM